MFLKIITKFKDLDLIISKNFNLILYTNILFAFIIRISLIIYFYYAGTIKFGAEDAEAFHLKAIKLLNIGISWEYFNTSIIPTIGWLYSYFLAFIYYITSPSILVGNVTSSFFWLFAVMVLNLILSELKLIKKYQIICILFFCFLPSSILLSLFTLREVYQVFFFLLSIYFYIRFYKYNKKEEFFLLLISTIFFALLHKALILVSSTIIYMAILSYFKIQIKSYKFFIISSILILLVILLNYFFFKYGFEEIETLRSGHNIGRATYAYETLRLNTSSTTNFITAIIFYFTKPFFYDWENIGDFVFMTENIIRIIVIYYIIINIFFGKNKTSFDLNLSIFLICIITEFLWAIGTVNWGTAIRHHYVVSPILYTLCFNFASKKNEK